jgi:hypothetical protein
MDINSIALIIVTAVINLAISNFVFLRYQKKIENSFAKSLFEHNTKFLRSHEKAVETLDNLFKKYVDFETSMRKTLNNAFDLFDSPYDQNRIVQQLLELSNIYIDFRSYYHANSLYLSEDVNDFFTRVSFINKALYEIVEKILMMPSKNNQPDTLSKDIETVNFLIKLISELTKVNLFIFDPKNPEMIRILYPQVFEVLNKQNKLMQGLYKSLLETK